MSPLYPSSDAETQRRTQRTRQPSIILNDTSTAAQEFANLHLPPIPRILSHDPIYPLSSSGGTFASSSGPSHRESSPYFQSNRHEERGYRSRHEHLSSSVPSVSDRFPTGSRHGSQMDYSTTQLAHPLAAGMSSFSQP
jgi:hypothetical protein